MPGGFIFATCFYCTMTESTKLAIDYTQGVAKPSSATNASKFRMSNRRVSTH
jgi:hypothetical protein